MKINLIIATYAGFYPRKFNEHNFREQSRYLRYNLQILNSLKTTVSQISIIKPRVNSDHVEIKEYYDLGKLDIPNIRDRIRIYETENIGVSYGQLFHGIYTSTASGGFNSNSSDFDYHIFIEDDYIPFRDYFELDFIAEHKKQESDSLVCSYYFKDLTADIMEYLTHDYYSESSHNVAHVRSQLEKYKWNPKRFIVPDFSLAVLSRDTVAKIQKVFNNSASGGLTDNNSASGGLTYNNSENIKEFFNVQFKKIELHQILFGCLLSVCDIKIYDIADTYLNIFYQSYNGSILLCNREKQSEVTKWRENQPEKKYGSPIFIPLNILEPNNYSGDISCMLKYLENPDEFMNTFNCLNTLKKTITGKLDL